MLIKLPTSITTTEHLDELLTALKSNKKTNIVQDFFESNPRLDPNQAGSDMVIEYLQQILQNPKLLRFSFAQIPDTDMCRELVIWARKNIDEQILIEVRVEPILVGGFVLRTPQKMYDYSWNVQMQENRGLLERMVQGVS